MLTPHEVAALLLIEEAAPNLADLDRAAIEVLVERQLVHLENMGSEYKPSASTSRREAVTSSAPSSGPAGKQLVLVSSPARRSLRAEASSGYQ